MEYVNDEFGAVGVHQSYLVLLLGVSTSGRATLIACNEKPILATDPWFGDENPPISEAED